MYRFVSINVEGSRHMRKRVLPFLREVQPDIVCMQELYQPDIPSIEEVVGPCFFTPTTLLSQPEGVVTEGLGIFSRLLRRHTAALQYYGCQGALPLYDKTSLDTRAETRKYVVALAVLGEERLRVATTHAPWTYNGQVDAHQHVAFPALVRAAEILRADLLCGDFNAPREDEEGRQGEMFSLFAPPWRDNIPPYYKTSLCIPLHKAGKERPHELEDKMVDWLLSKRCQVDNVMLVDYVSDHCAVVADVAKAE